MKEEWNLKDGLENVCNSALSKLFYAAYQLEDRERTIINLDSYEVTVLIRSLDKYMKGEKHENYYN